MDTFDEIVQALDYTMCIVTVANRTERSGCLVGFHMQCSMHPRRWLACLSKPNHTARTASSAEALAVHLVHPDQLALATVFGAHTDDLTDKFALVPWRSGPYGLPILDGCDWIGGPIVERYDFGDHIGHTIDVVEAHRGHAPAPQLGFQAVRHLTPGHPA